jgi:uncharacterized BrkB/YihY/UPF0761 family membrane protein
MKNLKIGYTIFVGILAALLYELFQRVFGADSYSFSIQRVLSFLVLFILFFLLFRVVTSKMAKK